MGHLSDARAVLVAGLRLAREEPDVLQEMAVELASLCERMGDVAGALSCAWHLRSFDRIDALGSRAAPADRARGWALRARVAEHAEDVDRASGWHTKAASLFAQERKWAHAAHHWERAAAYDRALDTWRRLARSTRRIPSVEALSRASEARIALHAAREGEAEAAFDRAVALLEELARQHASRGYPDLAAACHSLLVELYEAWQRPTQAGRARLDWEREARRYAGSTWACAPRAPLRSITAELLAWEDGWEITEHAADWMTSDHSRVQPGVAIELRLLALESDGKPAGAAVYALSRLAHGLADAGYEALGPLELLSRRRSAAVRVAVARSFGRLPGSRSLRALTRALDDPSPDVVSQARKSIAAMRRPELVGGLLTLAAAGAYGGGTRPDPANDATRQAAFAALAAMHEAEPIVSWILQHGGQADQRLMREVVRR